MLIKNEHPVEPNLFIPSPTTQAIRVQNTQAQLRIYRESGEGKSPN